MKTVTGEQMRQLEALAIADFEMPVEELMERAGRGLAMLADDFARLSGFSTGPVRLVAGRGNNGGDVFVAARHLHDMGYHTEVWLAGERRRLGAAATKHLDLMRNASISLEEVATPQDWEDLIDAYEGGPGLVIDGVLGTGIRGPARGLAAGAVQFVNALGESSPVIAVDVPSGINADTGQAEGAAVRADLTVTLGMPKRGLLAPEALEAVGTVEVFDIGIPAELADNVQSDLELITVADARRWLPARPRGSHKGHYGHVLILAGAAGYAGAAVLAARAAVRSGAGLVSVLTPECIAATVAAGVPEAMVHAGRQTARGTLAADALGAWGRSLEGFDAVLIGPGLMPEPETRMLMQALLAATAAPVVADADALNVWAGDPEALKAARGPLVATPHPGEMGRLLGLDVAAVQARRRETAAEAARRTGAVMVLKGGGTVVAASGQNININLTGNPGMARGGMGDVLAGLLAGLLAQGLAPFDAARLGVFLHGRAGDRVAWTGSQAGMSAGDVVEALPQTFSYLTPR